VQANCNNNHRFIDLLSPTLKLSDSVSLAVFVLTGNQRRRVSVIFISKS